MANFLMSSESSDADADANAFTQASATRRKNAAYNALSATYGPAAGDPDAQQQLQANQLATTLAPDKIAATDLDLQDHQLTTAAAQRADASSQARTVVNAVQHQIDNGVTPGVALDNVQHYLPALGVDPAHYAPLRAQIEADPAGTLKQIGGALDAQNAGKTKIQGSPIYSKDAKGNVHIHYVNQQGEDVPFGLPTGETPALPVAGTGTVVQGPPGPDGQPTYSIIRGDKIGDNVAAPVVGGAPVTAVQGDKKIAVSQQNADTQVARTGIMAENATSNRIRATKPAAGGGAGGGLSPQAIDYAATVYRTKGTIPGLGNGGTAMKAQIISRAAQMAADEGKTGEADVLGQQATAERGKLVGGLANFGPNGPGGKVQSANTLIAHAAVAQQLFSALNSGSVPAINQARQAYQSAIGQPAPANAALVAKALGDETAKFAIGSNAMFDRKSYEHALRPNGSPAQVNGAFDTVKQLAAGRLSGIRQGYVAAGAQHEFDGTLTPQAKQALGVPAASGTRLRFDPASGKLVPAS